MLRCAVGLLYIIYSNIGSMSLGTNVLMSVDCHVITCFSHVVWS